MEMASGAISIFAYTNWIVPLLLDLTIIVIDGFDVVFEGESSRFNEADSIEVASRNIAKISLKEVFRIVAKEALRMGTEVVFKSAANKTMTLIAKKVPFYGIIFGVVFAINRVAQNRRSIKNWILASFEVASGIVSVIPYIGTSVSFLIDMVITVVDVTNSIIENRKLKKQEKRKLSETDISTNQLDTIDADKNCLCCDFCCCCDCCCSCQSCLRITFFILSLFKSLLFYILLMFCFFTFIIFSIFIIFGNFNTCFLGCCGFLCNLGCNLTGNIFCS